MPPSHPSPYTQPVIPIKKQDWEYPCRSDLGRRRPWATVLHMTSYGLWLVSPALVGNFQQDSLPALTWSKLAIQTKSSSFHYFRTWAPPTMQVLVGIFTNIARARDRSIGMWYALPQRMGCSRFNSPFICHSMSCSKRIVARVEVGPMLWPSDILLYGHYPIDTLDPGPSSPLWGSFP